jgi:hypothetical protein
MKKNSSKLVDEKSGKNTLKIKKKKNDPYNLETIFMHKKSVILIESTSTRCGNCHNMLPHFRGLVRSLTFSPFLTYTMKHTHTSQKTTMARGWERDD